jgi:hypothetical protein
MVWSSASTWIEAPATDRERLLSLLRKAATDTGFVEGGPVSRHEARVVLGRFERAELLGIYEYPRGRFGEGPHRLVERLTPELPRFSLYCPDAGEWWSVEAGERVVELYGDMVGHYFGERWGGDPVEPTSKQHQAFSKELLALLGEFRSREFVSGHLRGHVGSPVGQAETIATFYRRSIELAPAIADRLLAAVEQAQREGSMEIPGVLRIRTREDIGIMDGKLIRSKGSLVASVAPEFRDRWHDGDTGTDLLESLAVLRNDRGLDVWAGKSLLFESVEYPAYEGRNPRTGEVIKVPSKIQLWCHLFA